MHISINNLTKKYWTKKALDCVSLEIGEGMFGLLGPNGAGKTTFMRILATLLKKSGGTVEVNGIDIGRRRDIRSMVGYLPQEFSFYPSMSVYEAMDYLAILSGISGARRRRELVSGLLTRVNLENSIKTKVRALSGGMKRRLGIAQALLNDPKLLIVDEPTAGLDPEERIRFRNLLGDFSAGRTVILSTHIVEDIEFTCEKLAVLNKGTLLFTGDAAELLGKAEGRVWQASVGRERYESIKRERTVISSVTEGDGVRVRLLSPAKPLETATTVRPTMEDAYMALMAEV